MNYTPVAGYGAPADFYPQHDTTFVLSAPGLLQGATDTDGDTISAWLYSDVQHGSLSLEANGSFSYTPDYHFADVDHFQYQLTDGYAFSDPITVSLTVMNAPPVAYDDVYSVDSAATLNTGAMGLPTVRGNDTDSDGDELQVSWVQDVDHGTLHYLTGDGNFLYTPPVGWTGTATFTYLAFDGMAASNLVATVSIMVTSSNQQPAFNPAAYTFSIAEDAAFGHELEPAATATDPDVNDTLAYTVTGGPFSIDSNGVIKLSGPLDYETTPSYTLTVTATDGSLIGTATVDVQVTDVNEAPVFDLPAFSFNIPENAIQSTPVGNVTAIDPDVGDTVTYSGGSGPFVVGSGGVITLNGPLDFETTPVYSFSASATDLGGLATSVPVTINITNINEAPVFNAGASTFSVPEDTAGGMLVANVPATDLDAGDALGYSIVGGSGAFSIDVLGAIRVIGGVLDYETTPSYTLNLLVTDMGGLTDTKTVTINVTDVNEPPVFDLDPYVFTVPENSPVNVTVVGIVSATDLDFGDFVTYSGGSAPFSVEPYGSIIVTGPLDFETTLSYTFTATATDMYGLSSTATVTINVTDVNGPPILTNVNASVLSTDFVQLNATIANGDPNDSGPLTATIEWGDGLATVLTLADGPFSTTHTYALFTFPPDDILPIQITLQDDEYNAVSATHFVTVTTPTLSEIDISPFFVPSTGGDVNLHATIVTGNFTIPGDLQVAWGDGTFTDVALTRTQTSVNVPHLFGDAGETDVYLIDASFAFAGENQSQSIANTKSKETPVFRLTMLRDGGSLAPAAARSVIVGQEIAVSASATLGGQPFDNWTAKWDVGGYAIAYYSQSIDEGKIFSLTDDLLHDKFLKFYWAGMDTTSSVTVTATVGGKQLQPHLVTFLISRPSAVMTLDFAEIDPSIRATDGGNGKVFIGLGEPWFPIPGEPNRSGMTFSTSVVTGNNQAGTLQYIQTAIQDRGMTTVDGVVLFSHIGNWSLDISAGAADPQYSSKSIAANTMLNYTDQDSPRDRVDQLVKYCRRDDFRTYVQYKPAGANSIFVTLAVGSWRWAAVAERDAMANGAGAWDFSFRNASFLYDPFSTDELPEWTDNVQDHPTETAP